MMKIWVTRHYILQNHAMYIYDKKSDHNPRRKFPSKVIHLCFAYLDVVYLRGLYFKKVYDKQNMHGLLLFSEGDRFKARRMYHKDEAVLDAWMRHLSKHCVFYSPAEVYE